MPQDLLPSIDHAPAGAGQRPSAFAASAGTRMALAALAIVALWLTVLWALAA